MDRPSPSVSGSPPRRPPASGSLLPASGTAAVDSDGDGIINSLDACPMMLRLESSDTDRDGAESN